MRYWNMCRFRDVDLTNQLLFEIRIPKYRLIYICNWLIHGTKCQKDNKYKGWNSPVEYPVHLVLVILFPTERQQYRDNNA